jgi:predicted alpha/beta superfamily hydrolase
MKITLLLLLFSLPICAFTQVKNETIEYSFNSKTFKEKRTISIFLPEAYKTKGSTTKFNVAYLFDGQFQPYTSMVSSIMSYYSETNEGTPLIIVGIHTENRWDEFVPICGSEKSSENEGADKLALFLKQEVIPYIDSKYRTTNFKIGIGHSLGGTFVLNEVLKTNSLFHAVIAVSPNLTVCNEQIITNAQKYYTENPTSNRFIYTTAGTSGDMENSFRESLLKLDSVTEKMKPKNLSWKCAVLENLNHMTTFVPTFDAAYLNLSSKLTLLDEELLKMAKDTSISIVEHITNFYNQLSSFSQEKQELDMKQLIQLSKTLTEYRAFRACKELCQFATEKLQKEALNVATKKEYSNIIEIRKKQAEFHVLASEAKKMAIAGNIKNASDLYLKAFQLDFINGTHIVRIDAVPILAQAGNIEEAFTQLDLLANKFILGGNNSFINDPLCKPLHTDKRWETLMKKLEENGGKYR